MKEWFKILHRMPIGRTPQNDRKKYGQADMLNAEKYLIKKFYLMAFLISII